MKLLGFGSVMMVFALSAAAKVNVTIDLNARAKATATFEFKQVPSPVRDDAAATAKLALVVGEGDRNGGELKALTAGILPADEDDPHSNFFFRAGASGGRFRMDFGEV